MERRTSFAAVAFWAMTFLAAPPALAMEPLTFTLTAGDIERRQTPVCIPLDLPDEAASQGAVVVTAAGERLPAQITSPSLLRKGAAAKHELWFLSPVLEAGKSLKIAVAFSDTPASERLQWRDTKGKHADLVLGQRHLLRYMYEPVDASSEERRMETYKPYHHLFSPRGDAVVTKGPGGLFPHHRGLFYGFNRISFDGQTADTWHCNHGESQVHEEFLSSEAGPVLGRHRLRISWRGQDGKPFAVETREMTAFLTTAGVMVDFASRLETSLAKVRLDGDPQHAGFQFRASQEVPDSTHEQTYYVRPDGVGAPGEFRNWPEDKRQTNLPWLALAFVLGGKRYTCCYLDRPENPKEARYSERDYGRFGSYFEYDLTPDKPLEIGYRLWLQEGEMEVEQVDSLSRQFTSPIGVAAG